MITPKDALSMVIRILILFLISLGFCVGLKAQPFIELNFSGSNNEGVTFNAGYQFHLTQDSVHRLSGSFGLGTNLWEFATSQGIAQAGLRYYFKRWGLGVECSAFTDNPLSGRYYYKPLPSVSVMPHLSYELPLWRKFYLRASAGPYFTYSRGVKHPFRFNNALRFDKNIAPALGISIGMRI